MTVTEVVDPLMRPMTKSTDQVQARIPRTSPAMATPFPVPFGSPALLRAIDAHTIAGIPMIRPKQKNPSRPRTNETVARPLVG